MAKEQEDNRDVFDKVADYIVPAVGAVAGRKLAKRLHDRAYSKKYGPEMRKYQKDLDDWYNEKEPTTLNELKSNATRSADLWDREQRMIARYRRGSSVAKVGGTIAGAGSGYVAGQEAKKRRK